MKMDALIKQGFEELEKKAEAILASNKAAFVHQGETHYKLDSADFIAWGTSGLSSFIFMVQVTHV